ncbi:MAG: hypothetical protein GYB66_11300, partial [Chloroflexi bacterium]|nr:hypothetical protein [Chloroflexota bacterium]
MEYVQLVLIVLIGGGIIVAANYSGRNQAVAALVLTSLAFMNVLTILVALTLPFVAADEVESVWAGAGVLALTGAIGMLLLLEPIRRAISNWFPPRSELQSEASFVPSAELSTPTYPPMMSDGELITLQPQSTPASASHAPSITNGQPKSTELLGFDPRSLVHTVALVFCVYVFGNQLASFVLGGGLAGLAEEVEITAGTLIANFIPLLILPLLGVGLFVRRSWPQVLDRLG